MKPVPSVADSFGLAAAIGKTVNLASCYHGPSTMVPKPLMMAREQITRLLPNARDNGLTSARNDNGGPWRVMGNSPPNSPRRGWRRGQYRDPETHSIRLHLTWPRRRPGSREGLLHNCVSASFVPTWNLPAGIIASACGQFRVEPSPGGAELEPCLTDAAPGAPAGCPATYS